MKFDGQYLRSIGSFVCSLVLTPTSLGDFEKHATLQLIPLGSSSLKNWKILELNRSEVGTTNAIHCQVLV